MFEEKWKRRLGVRFAIARPTFRDCLLAFVVIVSALLYFPLNHGPPHPHILTASLDGALPVVPLFAIPYIAFLPIFWLTVAYAFIKRQNFAVFALAIAFVYLVSDIVHALYPTYVSRPDHVAGFLVSSSGMSMPTIDRTMTSRVNTQAPRCFWRCISGPVADCSEALA